MTLLRALLADREAASAVEYALLAALISVAAMQAIGVTGNALSNTFVAIAADMSTTNSLNL